MKTRFAPSPTGHLHLGGARTALFAWLYARKFKGQFVLRLEDTDPVRSKSEYAQGIERDLKWLGIDWDEKVVQSANRERHVNAALQLARAQSQPDHPSQVASPPLAYWCECSSERLEQMRQQQQKQGQKPKYDGRCRNLELEAKEGRVLRLNLEAVIARQLQRKATSPSSSAGLVDDGQALRFDDEVYEAIVTPVQEMDDLVLIRSLPTGWSLDDDASLLNPTYNLCCAVDDLDGQIDIVIRGNDHVNNTPRQIAIFWALDAQPPAYAHLPLVHDAQGRKLSKRTGMLGIEEYRSQGILPQALRNALVLLGHHLEPEVCDLRAMLAQFSLNHISKSPARFDGERLLWLSQQHLSNWEPLQKIQQVSSEEAAQEFLRQLKEELPQGLREVQQAEPSEQQIPVKPSAAEAQRIISLAILAGQRAQTLQQLDDSLLAWWPQPPILDQKDRQALSDLLDEFGVVATKIDRQAVQTIVKSQPKMSKIIRLALIGAPAGPGVWSCGMP